MLELPVTREDPLARFLDPSEVGLPDLQAEAMFRSVYHWRPLLNGYNGYFPAALPERMRLAEHLPDCAALQSLRQTTALRMVLVRMDRLDAVSRGTWLRVVQDGESSCLLLRAAEGNEMLFEIRDRESGDGNDWRS